ncbi:MAG: hypothetical protein ACM3X4_11815 [Ignavibacteriales bacterium]
MTQGAGYIDHIDKSILNLLRDAFRISLKRPSLALFILRTLSRQKGAARRRLHWEKRGVRVPPFLIASITSRCNLNCTGCYAHAHHRPAAGEMTSERWVSVLREARDLGRGIPDDHKAELRDGHRLQVHQGAPGLGLQAVLLRGIRAREGGNR